MVESKLGYEEFRRQRVEENKKRMEELKLCKLAEDLRASTLKSTPVKQGKSRARIPVEPSSAPLRRSGRMTDKPTPNYREMTLEPLGRLRRVNQSRNLLEGIRASDEVRLYAIERAEKLESELGSEFPSFIKPMLQSHVSGGFWLGLPVNFCKNHLPEEDEFMSLVDEEGDESETKYLADKRGLSGGWRGFSISHQLADGDTLIFQLVKPTMFKVYIIRAHKSDSNRSEISEEKGKDVAETPSVRSSKRTKKRKSSS